MSGVKIYFVLYIVLLCEIFIVILDRDEAIQKIKNTYNMGDNFKFELNIPIDTLNITVFTTSQGGEAEQSDIIKFVISGKTLLKKDIEVKFNYKWKELSGIDTINFISPHFERISNDSTARIFSFQYFKESNERNQFSEADYANCKLEITCSFYREITDEIRSKMENNKGFNIKTKLIKDKEYIRLSDTKSIMIRFSRNVFIVPEC